MEIRHLKYFESLVRNQSFTKAAQELHISQPSLSNIIKTLEEELECKLLERNSREVNVTESGQVLYRHACHILQDFNNVTREMSDVKNVGRGVINIGMLESSKYWIPKVIRQFQSIYPSLNINFMEMGSNSVEKALADYEIHFGITSAQQSGQFKSIEIYQEEFVLIAPPFHRLANTTSIDLANLKDEKLIQFPTNFHISNILLNNTQTLDFELHGFYKVERIETARILVEAGLGLTIVPENYLKYSPVQGIHIVRLKKPTPIRKVYVTYDEHRYLPPAVKDLISLIKSFFEHQKPL